MPDLPAFAAFALSNPRRRHGSYTVRMLSNQGPVGFPRPTKKAVRLLLIPVFLGLSIIFILTSRYRLIDADEGF